MKLSVLMITYNHENFIAQALDSILMQIVDFDYEIVIGEDCSVDQTRDIVIKYQKRHPDKIRLLLHETNIGAAKNFTQAFWTCSGEYIAILEGDDYWTSPHKLQKQIDFLDANPNFVICYHNANYLWEDGSKPNSKLCPPMQKKVSTVVDLIYCNFIPTLTVMFRNRLFPEFPSWYHQMAYGDWTLHLLNAQYGKIGYINESMAVYRAHSGGSASVAHTDYSKWKKNIEGVIKIYEVIDGYFDFKYHELIASRMLFHRKVLKNGINYNVFVQLVKRLILKYPFLTGVTYQCAGLLRNITDKVHKVLTASKYPL